MKLKKTCNFIAYSKMKKKIIIKMIEIKCETNEIKKVALNFCISDASFKVDREKKKEKKLILSAKLTMKLIHVPHHCVKSIRIF